jgi:hypothetical protein
MATDIGIHPAARLSAFQRASLPLSFILDSATKKRLHAIAKSESRSVSGQLRVIVEKFVEQYEGIAGIPPFRNDTSVH